MNTHNIKKYAPQARNQFRDAVIQKLTTLGISADKKGALQIADAEIIGETVRYGQFDYQKSTLSRRDRLVKRARDQGFDVLVEHCAYTWFNRLCALRYMEIQGYLDHGFRMLSHPNNPAGFEVLDHVPEVAEALLPEKKAQLVGMKLSGNQDEALYRELLLAQCHALHRAMPFLFDAVDDEAELLLPDNLTRTDSILRDLVDNIPEDDWQEVEIIGWLYQFYISEKKDAVIGKVVKSEDIPAATQLFTPNWIVQYLVQNSVGRQWLQTYPNSPLKGKMEYYIEPAEQTPEVHAQLAAITPDSIDPESIKVLDPACGSGHILIEAYNVLKNIYEERGYRARDIPQLILENNIFGLDIDDRAAQLSGFSLLMMARQDDRRIFTRDVRLNIIALQESLHLDIAKLWQQLNFHQQKQTGSMGDMFAENTALPHTDSAEYQLLMRTLKRFVNAKTLGSLIQVPQEEEAELKAFLDALYGLEQEGDFHQKSVARAFIPYIQQAWILAQRYDSVVANPPYMGNSYIPNIIKETAKANFSIGKVDLYSIFILRCFEFTNKNSIISLMTPFTWLTIKSFDKLRKFICDNSEIISLVQPEYHSFFESAYVPICAFNLRANSTNNNGVFIDLSPYYGASIQAPKLIEIINQKEHKQKSEKKTSIFKVFPNYAFLFSLNANLTSIFRNKTSISDISNVTEGVKTGDNELFLRNWTEVSYSKTNHKVNKGKKWVLYHKGGEYRRWYGNIDYVINWEANGDIIAQHPSSGFQGRRNYFSEGITWSKLSSSYFGVRYLPDNVLFDSGSPAVFSNSIENNRILLGFLCSKVATYLVKKINPTLNFQVGNISSLPLPFISQNDKEHIIRIVSSAVKISKENWDSQETSIDFKLNILTNGNASLVNQSLQMLFDYWNEKISEMVSFESEINKYFIDLFKLSDELSIEPLLKEITLYGNPVYRYGELIPENSQNRLKSDSFSELLSYSIGCQMGRYSLDREGLVYAHEGNKGFTELVDEGAWKTFPADNDGILPLMDDEWFDDDVTARVKEFVCTVWGEEHLQENLEFIAGSLCLYAIKPKKGESALDTIRRYLSTQFWKDHLKMYKKRPIYWLFSSGKEKAFECLVYLHRYNDATLARMRTEYVVPLLARYQANIDRLNEQVDGASGGEATRLKRDRDNLSKKFNELRSFDDRLRHFADMRISIDLDDGVKVNYGKFGDLLADVKAITGNAPEVM
ncbi:BREX-1 system adenine-specific DNA-methyltransferase PglX [Pantoea sp.]|uniref:BREX-1 system adenine-specific DNA-methyltransferase PglX n=1 Tax=Pantoea sp. TaxID=69393 RepID=UPI0028ACD8C7|nr:BREX-1 system adenine-specific DNA-methyltransferase PglX [Pantoea sp.]